MPRHTKVVPNYLDLSPEAASLLLSGYHSDPHSILGPHNALKDGRKGVVVRVLDRNAQRAWLLRSDGTSHEMAKSHAGIWHCFLAGARRHARYSIRMLHNDGQESVWDDPYRFKPTLGDIDLHLLGEGKHLRLWDALGSHRRRVDGIEGSSFAVWAPNARGVSVVGDFNRWNPLLHPMRKLSEGGVWEVFIPGLLEGESYKYEIRSSLGVTRVKTDPVGFSMEQAPGSATFIVSRDMWEWGDDLWMQKRRSTDPLSSPMLIYELHLGSWMGPQNDESILGYREIAPLLSEHCIKMGFTHIELMPIQEHPYGGSWGYQVSGYFAPTSRYGSPDDLRFLIDHLHQFGIGVILDWVPAHFPKDDFALRRFDGTACYEHEDPRLAEHPEWGTLIFNFGRNEVRNFLLANALYWIEEFHIDGLRVDAVASMLYLDYGREAGQWLRNVHGGNENIEAVEFIKSLNHLVHSLHPGVVTIAEESTTWPGVTKSVAEGGLGFTFKWNMGWMHDTLDYFRVDPFFRGGAHDKLTFSMMYEYSERFVNPLSHDEVVHLKRSLLNKMPGDKWKQFANLRALIAYSIFRPGKSLLFMGTELGPDTEWNHDSYFNWDVSGDVERSGLMSFVAALTAIYRSNSCFWADDHKPSGFSWIDVSDREQSVFSFIRYAGIEHAVVVMNLTPVPRSEYRLGLPSPNKYRYVLSSDDTDFGGSGFVYPETVVPESMPYHGFEQSATLVLPPLSVVVLLPEKGSIPVSIHVKGKKAKLPKRSSGKKKRRIRKAEEKTK